MRLYIKTPLFSQGKSKSVVFLRTLLQFAKKKRKRSDSGSDLDLDVTPPPSPKDDEIIEKRRSGRNTNKRKKYVDDVDYNLSDEENLLHPVVDGAAAAPDGGGVSGEATPAATASGAATPGGASPTKDGSASAANTAPATPQVVTESGSGQSGPNYAFIVSAPRVMLYSRYNYFKKSLT